MGLLDDAIREHLELKRRHGADAAEVAKLEHDAFGPVRRGEDEEEPRAREVAAAPDEELANEPVRAESAPPAEPEPLPELEPLPEQPAPLPDEPAPLPDEPEPLPDESEALPPEPEPAAYEPAPRQRAEAEPLPPLEREPEPEPPADDPQATVAFDAADIEDDRPDPDIVAADEEHDELEETPDFLQETPEHDRLWFEQKPPRDFDF